MKILFRVDASLSLGTGHVMRCLTLAQYLKDTGAEVSFVCAEMDGNMLDYIGRQGFQVFSIPENVTPEEDAIKTFERLEQIRADLLIIDHYRINIQWETVIRQKIPGVKIMVIDDLANRPHDCDLLLDQNYLAEYEKRYNHLVPAPCKKLLGPKFLILRPEFYKERCQRKIKQINNILVFYGGSDPTNETMKALKAFEVLSLPDVEIHVVVGQSNDKKEAIERFCNERGYQLHVQINYLSELMSQADLSLGAGGVTMWERCFLGLPSIVTVVAENQIESTRAAAEQGAIWNLGWHESVKVPHLVDIIKRAIAHPEELQIMSEKALKLMGGDRSSNPHPVVEEILKLV